jgi:hypothetical protein
MLSLGTVLYLVIRSLPRIEDDGVKEKRSIFEKWLLSEAPERADLFLSNLLAKWLRKLKIFLLKMDNLLSRHLKKIKPRNGEEENLNGGFMGVIENSKSEEE